MKKEILDFKYNKKKFKLEWWQVLRGLYLALNIFIMVFPLYFMFLGAFKTNQEITLNPFGFSKNPFTNVLANIQSVLDGKIGKLQVLTPYLTMLYNTVTLTFFSLLGVTIVALLAGYALGRMEFKFKNAIIMFILVIQIVPFFGYITPMFYTMNTLKLLNNYTGVVLVYIAVSLPSTIVLMQSFFRGFPKAIEEAAIIDGCTEVKKFLLIIIPMSKGIIASMAVINFMGYWNEFVIVSLLVNDPNLRTINVGIFATKTQLGGAGKLNYIFTLLAMSAIPNLLFFTAFQKSIVKGVSLGGVKG